MAGFDGVLDADRVRAEDGLPVLSPRNADEVAAVLRHATAHGLAVRVRGGGTKAGWGAPPERIDAILSTEGLARIVDHAPGDMTCVVEAGVRLADLQAAIAGVPTHRQRLMLDPPGGEAATIGGVVATAASGPRRTRYGTPRDLVLGARYVTGDGLAAATGGRVVKNVAGYDVAKLLIGSRGSLAVVTEVALKLHPLPEAARTAVLRATDADRIAGFCDALRTAPVTPALVEVAWPEGVALVRIESTEAGADAQVERLRALADVEVLDDAEGGALADRLAAAAWEGDAPVLAVGARPSRLAGVLRAVGDAGAVAALRAPVLAGEVRLPDDDPDRAARLVAALRDLGANVAVRRGDGLRSLVATERDPAAAGVERRLRERLDPAGVLAGAVA